MCLPLRKVVLLWEPQKCLFWGEVSCPSLIASMDPHACCFECLGSDHAADGIKMPPPCVVCPVLRLSAECRVHHCWDYFHLLTELVCNESEQKWPLMMTLQMVSIAFSCHRSSHLQRWRFYQQRKTTTFPWCPPPQHHASISVHCDFPSWMTIPG